MSVPYSPEDHAKSEAGEAAAAVLVRRSCSPTAIVLPLPNGPFGEDILALDRLDQWRFGVEHHLSWHSGEFPYRSVHLPFPRRLWEAEKWKSGYFDLVLSEDLRQFGVTRGENIVEAAHRTDWVICDVPTRRGHDDFIDMPPSWFRWSRVKIDTIPLHDLPLFGGPK